MLHEAEAREDRYLRLVAVHGLHVLRVTADHSLRLARDVQPEDVATLLPQVLAQEVRPLLALLGHHEGQVAQNWPAPGGEGDGGEGPDFLAGLHAGQGALAPS